ncbi:MAG: FAD-dependent thymidylate synthase [Bacillati bacterium ANGP1]|uniref:Flavin-dependent thymidylate synthase n=1 Tax=Candidatus Segetimicrobium genomatis TaxID=2569760 RepID=A0A537LPP7_9BACT|nr:MAG: FAD-dependent thymidylate synthase [Terrabacteria group bacterium ANGP1]TMJ09988.1 MAG: FAD-dependent thymidylate synthase [Terrabacteria group bacterium ANGP1]
MLLAATPDADRLAAMAARQCYSAGSVLDLPQPLSPKQTAHLVNRVVSAGHTSCVEHNQFVFGVRGISRSCSHQLVRHRVGWSYEQQSQRYVDFSTQDYVEIVVPPTILRLPEMLESFLEPVKAAVRAYFLLRDERVHQEDARYLFNNAFETKLVISANARALLHFFELRTCNLAQWEIRWLAHLMRAELQHVAPEIFKFAGPTCMTQKICWEGPRGAKCPRLGATGATLRDRTPAMLAALAERTSPSS